MISGLLFRSACLPCFQPKDRWQALMWWLVFATEAGVLSSCIRFLLKWMWLRHTKHIFFLQILSLKYVFAVPLNYIWLTDLESQVSHKIQSGRGSGSLGVNWSPSGEYKALVRRDHSLLSGPQAWGWPSSLSSPPSLQSNFSSPKSSWEWILSQSQEQSYCSL